MLAALCLVSFLFGCTVTDQRLCRVMMAVSAAASGRLPEMSQAALYAAETYPSGAGTDATNVSAPRESDQTYYQKYRAAETVPAETETPLSGSLDYLTAHESTACGTDEALRDWAGNIKPLSDWVLVRVYNGDLRR